MSEFWETTVQFEIDNGNGKVKKTKEYYLVSADSDNSGISSNAIGMNLLSVNPHLVIVDENQKPLMKLLKQYRIDSCPMPMRHSRTLGGGFHCVTLDLKRG